MYCIINDFYFVIKLLKEGYPERVCDYCQLQLNTFHAFVRKAKITSNQFESILQELKQNVDDEDENVTNNETLSNTDMEFEDGVDDAHHKNVNQSIEVEYFVDNDDAELKRDEIIGIPTNSEEGLNLNFIG